MLSRSNLHVYQTSTADMMIREKSLLVAMGLGLGKTLTTLTALVDVLNACAVSRALIVSTLRVCNTVWKQEAANWQHLQHLTLNIATGSEAQRKRAIDSQSDAVIINCDNIQWLVDTYAKKWPFDVLILDESTLFKNGSSKRFKALKKTLSHYQYVWLLSATPMPNGPIDLWSQMYLIDQGKRLGKTKTNFMQRFFESDYMGYKFSPREGAPDKISSLVADKVLRLSTTDHIDMPDLIEVVQTCQLSSSAVDKYRTFEREYFAEFEGQEIEALNAASLTGKLLQLANGAIYTGEGQWAEFHDSKLDALAELIELNPDENILLAYNFKSDLARILAKFPHAVQLDKDQTTVDRWNQGEIKLLLAHPQSAGHGLNLQRGGALCVWFGLNWSLELIQQLNGRLYRQGQSRAVRIVYLVAEGTIDSKVLSVIRNKDATQSAMLEAVNLYRLETLC